jgi:hypothetical protein
VWIRGIVPFVLCVLALPVAAQNLERVSLNSGWRFHAGDPPAAADNLVYDVLKPWVLPSANPFIEDAARRHVRPEGDPGSERMAVWVYIVARGSHAARRAGRRQSARHPPGQSAGFRALVSGRRDLSQRLDHEGASGARGAVGHLRSDAASYQGIRDCRAEGENRQRLRRGRIGARCHCYPCARRGRPEAGPCHREHSRIYDTHSGAKQRTRRRLGDHRESATLGPATAWR